MYGSSLGDGTVVLPEQTPARLSRTGSISGETDTTTTDTDADAGDDVDMDDAVVGCRAILDRMVDPAIELCVLAAEEKHRVRPSWDREVFVINAMTYLQVSASVPNRLSYEARHHVAHYTHLERVRAVCVYN